MLKYKRESQEWLEFEIFQDFKEIEHAVFIREANPFKWEKVVWANQVHGTTVIEAVSSGESCDGLITDKEQVGLLIKHADCQAALFYDPVNKVIGNIHVGWRGQIQDIYKKMILKLNARYASKPQDLIVAISPSLGPCCAEFIHYQNELPALFWHYQVRPFYFDLWSMASEQLLEAGILPHHLQIACICTCCSSDHYFSYRRDKIKGRNQSTVIRRII